MTHICICRKIFNNFHQKRESIDQNSFRVDWNHNRRSVNYSSDNNTRSPAIRPNRMHYSVKHSKNTKKQTQALKARNSCPNIALPNSGFSHIPRTHSLRSVSRAKIKTVKITIVIMLFYVLCSLPFISVQLWVHWFPNTQQYLASSKS